MQKTYIRFTLLSVIFLLAIICASLLILAWDIDKSIGYKEYDSQYSSGWAWERTVLVGQYNNPAYYETTGCLASRRCDGTIWSYAFSRPSNDLYWPDVDVVWEKAHSWSWFTDFSASPKYAFKLQTSASIGRG